MKSIMMIAAIVLASPASAASVNYHRFGDTTYGSDGSKSHEFGGTTYVTPGPRSGRKPYRCRSFAGTVTCED